MKVGGGAPVYSVKTALRESFDETHGGSLAFISEGNLKRSERGRPREVSYTMLFSVVNRLKLCV